MPLTDWDVVHHVCVRGCGAREIILSHLGKVDVIFAAVAAMSVRNAYNRPTDASAQDRYEICRELAQVVEQQERFRLENWIQGCYRSGAECAVQ